MRFCMRKTVAVVLILGLLAGCASLTNPFGRMAPDYSSIPQDDLRAVAIEIEKAVADSNRDVQIADRGGIIVNTPEIQQAIRTRAARTSLTKSFLDTGYACEMRSGLLNTLRSSDYKKNTSKRDRDRYALLVMGENGDRWAIYEGILKASHLAPRSLSAIQETFFNARVDLLSQGQKYEAGDGKTVSK